MKPIRNSAKAVIIEDGKILLTKNIDDAGYFYLFPGGGQEPGEELRQAVVRECSEEIGQAVNVGELLFIREYIGRNHEFSQTDGDLHQVEFYFRCGLKSREGTLGNGSNPDTYQVGVEWVDLRQLANIRVYPKSLGKKLQEDCFSPIYLGDVN
jgi:8-oxo-dGTP diphosphatase